MMKRAPQSPEAEGSVLAALIMQPEQVWPMVQPLVKARAFFRPEHCLIYETIEEMLLAGHPVDLVTVADRVSAKRPGEWFVLLAEITESYIGSVAMVEEYARTVRDRWLRRQLIHIGMKIQDIGFDKQAEEAFAESIGLLSDAGNANEVREIEPMPEHLRRFMETLEQRRRGEISGLRYGLLDLDRRLNPMRPGDLIVVGARPSMGKTTLALNIAQRLAADNVVYFRSAEMDADSIVEKMVATEGRILYARLLSGDLAEDDYPRLTHAMAQLKNIGLYIDDRSAPTLSDVRADAMRVKAQTGRLDMVVIDYLQLMRGTNPKENRVSQLTEITQGLKAMGKEMGCVVMLLSQLNRNVEMRKPPRPILADLRDSGSIEQDADTILLLYNDTVYNPQSPWGDIHEVIIGKQRKGPRNTVCYSLFDKQRSTFLNADPADVRRLCGGEVEDEPAQPAYEWHAKGADIT